MTAILFDTLEFAAKLKAGGFTEQQAETQARAMADIVEKQLNTRQEIQEHENRIESQIIELKRDIKELELKNDAKLSETKAELIRWVVGVGLLQITIITALLLKITSQL
jgi:hypothetical protein